MIQISINNILILSISLSLLLAIVGWLLKEWIGARIDKSIQYEYDKKIEEYKFSQLQRQKAELVANFFARWIKYRGKESIFLSKIEQIEHYEHLNKMSLELAIWLKDEELLKEIMSLFTLGKKKGDVRELTGKIRKLILENKDDKFDPQEIIIWPAGEAYYELFGTDSPNETINKNK